MESLGTTEKPQKKRYLDKHYHPSLAHRLTMFKTWLSKLLSSKTLQDLAFQALVKEIYRNNILFFELQLWSATVASAISQDIII